MTKFFDRFKTFPFNYLLLLLGGVSLTLSFAPFNFSVLAWFSFIPMFLVLRDGKRPFMKGFIMGFAFFATLLYWVPFSDVENAVVPQVILGSFVLVVYLSAFFGLSAILYNKLNFLGYTCLFPIVFAGLEFARSLSSVWGFPWGSIGFSQSNLIHLVQFAAIGGLPLVTAWVLFINVFIYLFVIDIRSKKRKKRIYLCVLISLLIIPLVYSEIILKRENSSVEYKNIGVIQPNVLPRDKRNSDVGRLKQIKKVLHMSPSADLYVLPETASPFSLSGSPDAEVFFSNLAKDKNAPIITGTLDYKRKGKKIIYYNAAAVVDSSGVKGIYRKIFLVPFVERLPFDDVLPKLRDINLGQGGFTPGSEFTVFEERGINFCVYICFEAIFSQLVREFVNNGAELLINITEDGWFGVTSGPYQHAQMAAFQSIIFRRSLVRSANTGVSFVCSPFGEILKKTKTFKEGFIVCEVPLMKGKTVYAKIGNTFGWVFLSFVLLLFIYRKEEK